MVSAELHDPENIIFNFSSHDLSDDERSLLCKGLRASDKSNSVVLLDKDKYLEGMSKILNNNARFEMLQFDHDKELNYFLNLEKKLVDVLKDLKNKEVDYNHLYPCSFNLDILYGIAKVNKPVINQC